MDPEQKKVLTSRGQTLRYDTLVIATGAIRLPAVPGALTFSDRRDIAPLQRLLGEVEQGRVSKSGSSFPVEPAGHCRCTRLALLTSAWAERHGKANVEITLATPESGPLGLFGQTASTSVRELLDRRNITFIPSSYPVRFEKGVLELAPSLRLELDRVVALPQIEGPRIAGLPGEPTASLRPISMGWFREYQTSTQPATRRLFRSSRGVSRHSRPTRSPGRLPPGWGARRGCGGPRSARFCGQFC